MLNVTNQVGEDKSRWPKDNLAWPEGNTAETNGIPDLCLTGTTCGGRGRFALVADGVCDACTLAAAWLIGLPRRAGRWLFAMNDAEAGWQRWQVTETLGGLGRQYRDARFDALSTDPAVRSDRLRERAVRSDDGEWRLGGDV